MESRCFQFVLLGPLFVIFLFACGGQSKKSESSGDTGGNPSPPGPPTGTASIEGKAVVELVDTFAKPSPEALTNNWEPGEQILVAKSGVSEDQVRKAAAEKGLEVLLKSGTSNIYLANCKKTRQAWKSKLTQLVPGQSIDNFRSTMQGQSFAQMRQLAQNANVFERVTPNYLLTYKQEQVDYIENRDQWALTQWQMEDIWTRFGHGKEEVRVAVIDTGLFRNHPNLDSRIDWANGYDFVSDASRSGDDDGFDNDPSENSSMGSGFHGTHVSGIIASYSDANQKIQGIAGGIKIIPLRALAADGGTNFDIAQAVLYAAGLKNATDHVANPRADIINMSLGGSGYSPVLGDAIRKATEAGLIVIAAAGNEHTTTPSYPAALPEVIGVGALDPDGERAPYSNGGTNVDVMAPGGAEDRRAPWGSTGIFGGILSTFAARDRPMVEWMSGTSMASPHISALVALMLSQNKSLTAPQIRKFLFDATDSMACEANLCGRGKANPAKALESAKNGKPVDRKDPTEVFIVLTDTKGSLISWTSTSNDKNYAFSLSHIPTGEFYVRIGTDQDGNGTVCDEAKDYCGYLGSGSSPDVVRVSSGQKISNLEIHARINSAGGWKMELLGGKRS